jgi:hypothetical protein
MNFERWTSFSVANTSQHEAKLTYIKLNTQTPCPPRGAVRSTRGRGDRFLHPARPVLRCPQLITSTASAWIQLHP